MSGSWSKDLATGLEVIDAQHREYFARVDKLLNACLQDTGGATVRETFAFMQQYLIHHFATEEGLMTEHAYPQAAMHKKQHVWFAGELDRLHLEIDGPTGGSPMPLNGLLVDWFRNHIKTMDCRLTGFIKTRIKTAQDAPR